MSSFTLISPVCRPWSGGFTRFSTRGATRSFSADSAKFTALAKTRLLPSSSRVSETTGPSKPSLVSRTRRRAAVISLGSDTASAEFWLISTRDRCDDTAVSEDRNGHGNVEGNTHGCGEVAYGLESKL
ncbi:unnamed protein product [Phytophthora fragariaefolia]|uniref:Unnamed protein product n=1 Tax=Phytophthora fragariaefolia TaxID=1490495 RepID=A0A9W7CYA2_9STRA|nr:unnamed protein product [Phytophthora fragariaefolia]